MINLVHVYAQGKVSRERKKARQSPKADSGKNIYMYISG